MGMDSVHALLIVSFFFFFFSPIGRSGVDGKDPIGSSLPSGGKQVRH